MACGILWIDLLVVPTHSPRRQLSLYKELRSSFKTNLLWKVKTYSRWQCLKHHEVPICPTDLIFSDLPSLRVIHFDPILFPIKIPSSLMLGCWKDWNSRVSTQHIPRRDPPFGSQISTPPKLGSFLEVFNFWLKFQILGGFRYSYSPVCRSFPACLNSAGVKVMSSNFKSCSRGLDDTQPNQNQRSFFECYKKKPCRLEFEIRFLVVWGQGEMPVPLIFGQHAAARKSNALKWGSFMFSCLKQTAFLWKTSNAAQNWHQWWGCLNHISRDTTLAVRHPAPVVLHPAPWRQEKSQGIHNSSYAVHQFSFEHHNSHSIHGTGIFTYTFTVKSNQM